MAKKDKPVEEEFGTTDEGFGGEEVEFGLDEVDFNVDDEYKPNPLIPKATYHAVVTGVKFNAKLMAIEWDFCLHDNNTYMNDGETPVDGAHITFYNWLPRPGDESVMTKSGRSTKRQSKINMLGDFQEEMEIDMGTPTKIAEALAEQTWIGLEADLDVDIDEWNGMFRNNVSRCKKSTLF